MSCADISQGEFDALRAYVRDHSGIAIGDNKRYLLESRLRSVMRDVGCDSFSGLYVAAQHDRTGELCDKIIDALTTNETLWFRDESTWEAMRSVILPDLLDRTAGKIRLWCAACATGQEPYSLAMTIADITSPASRARFEILATDISAIALFTAISGRYNRAAMSRGLSSSLKARYFREDGHFCALRDDIKAMITFRRFNLQDSFAQMGEFDLILMRNVTIYFSPSFKKELYRRVAGALTPGGYLLLGSSETLLGFSTDFETVSRGRATCYRVTA